MEAQNGLKTTGSTGGYINPEPLRLLAKYVDAFSVSIKGFTEDVYKQYCRGSLKTVLTAMETVRGEGAWLEVVALLIPGVSDDSKQIRWFCEWMFRHLGADTPLHFSRFYPSYKLKNLPPTPVSTLEEARKTALSTGLKYVYIGNLPGHNGGNTYCTKCRSLVVQRIGFRVVSNRVRRGSCPTCGTGLPGRWV
ncbi:MAG: hypothetical protein HYU64_02095 [Armatimonadetes bacterium]|nr:hypothetical protein [Armatimonadota bacterium]